MNTMIDLYDIVSYCNQRLTIDKIKDFPGAENGLQFANNGKVSKIGAAVDAGLVPFQIAAEKQIDFLIVHHGLFWQSIQPVTHSVYQKFKTLIDADCAVYGAHLPLDCHPDIGNNALLAKALKLDIIDRFLDYEGTTIGLITQLKEGRRNLKTSLQNLFPDSFIPIEYGSDNPKKIAILTGSGASALEELSTLGIDTLITGELKQQHFNIAQEQNLNLYLCGHYASETFGVAALAEEVAKKFNLAWEFIKTDCPL